MSTTPDRATEPGSPVPADPAGGVSVHRGPLAIPTNLPAPPDRYPAYLDNRVYQGSSGRVYPLPFHERIEEERHDVEWDAVTLANEYVSLVILPELGGRILHATDLTRDYDLFYRNRVIKPALVGLTGPWISGGVEFNWPQHHRPATFLPTACAIEHEADGAVTVWCSDHDPFDRMKGMHGVRLRPASAVIELRVRLLNRSEDVRTFLWWANVAARVHDEYQAFFPTDVHHVADHAKRAITSFPAADRPYYGWDYPEAARTAERGPGEPAADRLDFYRNVAVPTSYMCLGSDDDFFGGYDHAEGAGFVHVADHRIAPGKKMWTWGNSPFGWAWDRNLTDEDGPYVELMAGVYTDNQPDFSFLAPGETKAFSQYWYPIQDIGPAHAATCEAAARLDLAEDPSENDATGIGPHGTGRARIAVATTRARSACEVALAGPGGAALFTATADIAPGSPLVREIDLPPGTSADGLVLEIRDGGEMLVRLHTTREDGCGAGQDRSAEPEIATEPPAPEEIGSTDELYLTGRHLEQYRHATRRPQPYWEEALRRDPGDARSATALAVDHLRRGELARAEELLRTALARLTRRNPNPETGEVHHRLGQVLERTGREHQALEAYGKAAWDGAWTAAADLATARILARRGTAADDRDALERIDGSWSRRAPRNQQRCLAAVLLRRLDRAEEAGIVLAELIAEDPLDQWALHLAGRPLAADGPTLLDVALEQISVGEDEAALGLLADAASAPVALGQVAIAPLAHLHRADVLTRLGREDEAESARREAEAADATWCLASRPADLDLLERTVAARPQDVLPRRLLGHLLYHLRRRDEAVRQWEAAISLRDDDPVTRRNLAVAAVNVSGDEAAADAHYRRARELDPEDSRLLYEHDQLRRRAGERPEVRLAELEAHPGTVAARDDLTLELAGLLTATGRAEETLEILRGRDFQPWEGGEGVVLEAWEEAHLALARAALAGEDPALAERHLREALDPILSLGEGRHPLANTAHLDLALGDALAAQGDGEAARAAWRSAAASVGDFRGMETVPYSDLTRQAVLACRRLGESARADELVEGLAEYADELARTPARVDYFATSLPSMLLFTPDLRARRESDVALLRAQVASLRGDEAGAREQLDAVLAADPNRVRALDLARELEAGRAGASVG